MYGATNDEFVYSRMCIVVPVLVITLPQADKEGGDGTRGQDEGFLSYISFKTSSGYGI